MHALHLQINSRCDRFEEFQNVFFGGYCIMKKTPGVILPVFLLCAQYG